MKTTIAEIKKLPVGTEIQGIPLLIKTARRAFADGENRTWQEVVFMDVSGEMLGHILLPTVENHDKRTGGYTPWQSKTNLCIMQAIVQATEDRNKQDVKLVVTDCFNTATPLTYAQNDELTADDWQRMHEEEIDGKIRHGLTLTWVGACKRLIITDEERKLINGLVEFIKRG
jgi:hypothetical protein